MHSNVCKSLNVCSTDLCLGVPHTAQLTQESATTVEATGFTSEQKKFGEALITVLGLSKNTATGHKLLQAAAEKENWAKVTLGGPDLHG